MDTKELDKLRQGRRAQEPIRYLKRSAIATEQPESFSHIFIKQDTSSPQTLTLT